MYSVGFRYNCTLDCDYRTCWYDCAEEKRQTMKDREAAQKKAEEEKRQPGYIGPNIIRGEE